MGRPPSYAVAVPAPVRVALRLLGLLLLLLSAACLVVVFVPGPRAVAEVMGVGCAYSRHGPSEQCSSWDAVKLLWTGVWVFAILGLVLRLTTRRPGQGPRTLDLRRLWG